MDLDDLPFCIGGLGDLAFYLGELGGEFSGERDGEPLCCWSSNPSNISFITLSASSNASFLTTPFFFVRGYTMILQK